MTTVLIWSIEHKAWWRSNSQGYTLNLATAGLYDEETAESIVKSTSGKNEKIVPLYSAFKDLQCQAIQSDRALIQLLSKTNEINNLIYETRILERI